MSEDGRDASEPCGTVAYQQCVNPACLAEEGDRHYSDCSPVTPSRTSDMTPDQAASLARALLAHTCDECDPPMIVCDDSACEPYGEHHMQQHGTAASADPGASS